MGRAQSTTEQRFKSLFGARRGSDYALRGPHAVAAWERLVSRHGLEDALRTLGSDRDFITGNPELAQAISEDILDESYAEGAPLVRQWLKNLGVRPHWMEEIVSVTVEGPEMNSLHLLAPGHIAADTKDINEQRPPLVCTGQPADDSDSYMVINRGAWGHILASSNPAMPKICPVCAVKAQGHVEAQDRDEMDPWPADALDGALEEWRRESRELIIKQAAEGDELLAMEDAPISSLYGRAASWAAARIAAHPRELAIRALRSNGAGNAALSVEDKRLPRMAKGIARLRLSEGAWLEEILTHRENEGTAGDWAGHLVRLASTAPESPIVVRHSLELG